MRLVMLGPPGAGKGTQAGFLSERLGVPQISTGDIFREAVRQGGELGMKAREYLDRGELVPDQVVLEIVARRCLEPDCSQGFILDGFPRTLPQAEAFDAWLEERNLILDSVIEIDVPDEEIVRRLINRRSCPKCCTVYNLISNPPMKSGVCDVCGSNLVQRDDDTERMIRQRLRVYQKETQPLVEYYRKGGKLRVVQGNAPLQVVKENLLKVSLGELV